MPIHHVGTSVPSLPEATTFFEEVFSLTVDRSWANESKGIRGTFMKDEKGSVLELIEALPTETANTDYSNLHEQGLRHLAMLVENVDTTYTEILKRGGREVTPPQDGIAFARTAFIEGPYQIVFELLQPKES